MVVDKLVERSLRDQRSAVRIQSSANFHVEHLFTVNCTVLKIWKKRKRGHDWPIFYKKSYLAGKPLAPLTDLPDCTRCRYIPAEDSCSSGIDFSSKNSERPMQQNFYLLYVLS